MRLEVVFVAYMILKRAFLLYTWEWSVHKIGAHVFVVYWRFKHVFVYFICCVHDIGENVFVSVHEIGACVVCVHVIRSCVFVCLHMRRTYE